VAGDALAELGARCQGVGGAAGAGVGKVGKKVEPAAFKPSSTTTRARWRLRAEVAAEGGRHDARAAPDDAERRAGRVARAPAAVHAGGRGFEDLLGKRTGGVARVGGVLPARWQE
jgi:hypothetical protein